MLKVVIDTSVFIAGLLTTNPFSSSYQVLSIWKSGAFKLVMSPQILRELVAKMFMKEISDDIIFDFIELLEEIALNIPGVYQSSKLDKAGRSDNKFLAAAYEAKAQYLISLDKHHLLPLKHFHGTQIVTPDLFLRILFE